jgi:alkylation response protein AidB-like acyl-CoA dehydrogenase
MDMKLTDEQMQLQDAARRFMDEQCPMDFVREMEASELGFSRAMWKQMAEMGWLGIDLPIELGGLGLGTLDLTLLMKELGRHLCPVPILPTAVIAGEAIVRAGTESQRRRYVEQIVAGEIVIAFAYQEFTRFFGPGEIKLEARRSKDGFVLNGTKMFVEYAGGADLLLVVARTSEETRPGSGLTMFLLDAKADGVVCTHTPTMARDRHYEVCFRDVAVPRASVLGRVDEGWSDLEPALHKGALAFSAFTNGASFELHERATEFARTRVQFGRPIGQLQTIQGYLAQLIMEILGADVLTMFTAFHMDRGHPVRGYVAKAKGFSAETVARTMDIGSQIFGGMGYMEEVDTTLYLRRGKQYQLMLGGTDYWYDVVAEEVIDVEEPVLFG